MFSIRSASARRAAIICLAAALAPVGGPADAHPKPDAGLRIGMPEGDLSRLIGRTLPSGSGARMAPWDGDFDRLGHGGCTASAFAVVYLTDSSTTLACRNGLLLALHPGEDGCLRAAPGQSLVPAADQRRLKLLHGWSSLWETVRLPGRRGLPRDPRGTLEVALLADGVAPSEVYRQLETGAGQDRAFRRLDQLRPYIAWWSSPAQAMDLLRKGNVVMVAVPAGDAGERSAGGPSVPIAADWAIPAAQDATRQRRAIALLDRLTDPARPEAHPAGLDEAASTAFWRSHYTILRQRFDAWLAAR